MSQIRTSKRVFAQLALLALAGAVANTAAQTSNCWAPDFMQPLAPSVARTTSEAEWKNDFEIASAVLKKVRALQTIPQTRLRVQSFIGVRSESMGHFARVSAMLFPPQAWAAGECGLIQGPDFFNTGHLDITFNDPQLIFEHHAYALKELGAYFEPQAAARVGEETVYRHGKYWLAVLTPERLSPWAPITTDEYLRFKETAEQQKLEDLERSFAEAMQADERLQQAMAGIAELKKSDPALAEQMQKTMAEERARWEKEKPGLEKQFQQSLAQQRQELSVLRAFQSNLSPAERQAQAHLGNGRFGLAWGGTEDRGGMVRLNPALRPSGKSNRRIQLIVVQPFANDATLWEEMGQAMQEVDYAAFRQLLR